MKLNKKYSIGFVFLLFINMVHADPINVKIINQYEAAVGVITIFDGEKKLSLETKKDGSCTIDVGQIDSLVFTAEKYESIKMSINDIKENSIISLHKKFTWKDLFNPMFYVIYGGLWFLLFIIFAETGLFAGFFLPGDSLLFVAGIYSNNLDEFFRVRVANLRRMIAVKKKQVDGFKGTPTELYTQIRKTVLVQQEKFELAYKQIFEELAQSGIFQVDENSVIEAHKKELESFFELKLKHAIVPIMLDKKAPFPKLKDSSIYLAVKIVSEKDKKTKFALIQIPPGFSRFYLMKDRKNDYVILLDDVIRLNLEKIFSIFNFQFSLSILDFRFLGCSFLVCCVRVNYSSWPLLDLFISWCVQLEKSKTKGLTNAFFRIHDYELR
jgi:hypothetical protein